MARSWKLIALAVAVGCLLAPASSEATLVFTRNLLNPTVYVANDDGSVARKVGPGSSPYAVTVNPRTGAERTLTREREVGFVGTALSKDGSAVLGSLGGFEPGPGHRVVTIPYGGGKPKVLAGNAAEPDWSR